MAEYNGKLADFVSHRGCRLSKSWLRWSEVMRLSVWRSCRAGERVVIRWLLVPVRVEAVWLVRFPLVHVVRCDVTRVSIDEY